MTMMNELLEKIEALPDGRFLFMPNNPPVLSDMVAKTDDLKTLVRELADSSKPLNMVLHCPNCRTQHIDAPEPDRCRCSHWNHHHDLTGACNYRYHPASDEPPCDCGSFTVAWTNPPHKSHLCHSCGTIWRPADVPTNGVAAIETRGEKDTWPEVAA